MTNEQGQAWQRLCEEIAHENDPRRLLELVDHLLKELDSRKKTLRKSIARQESAPDRAE